MTYQSRKKLKQKTARCGDGANANRNKAVTLPNIRKALEMKVPEVRLKIKSGEIVVRPVFQL